MTNGRPQPTPPPTNGVAHAPSASGTDPRTAPVITPSTDGPVTAAARALYRELTALGADQASQSVVIVSAHATAKAQADAALRSALDEIDALEKAELGAAEADKASDEQTQGAKFSAERTALERRFSGELADLHDRAQRDLSRAAKARDDALWLCDSVYDTKKDRPKQQGEAQKVELDQRLAIGEQIRAQADDFLSRCRCGRVPAALPASGPLAPDPEAAARMQAALDGAVIIHARLRRMVLPRLFQEIVPFVLMVLGFGFGVALHYVIMRATTLWPALGTGGLVALVVFVVLVPLLGAAGTRTGRVAAELNTALSSVREEHASALAHGQLQRVTAERALLEARNREAGKAKAEYGEIDSQVREALKAQTAALRTQFGTELAALADRERTGRTQTLKTHDFRVSSAKRDRVTSERAARARFDSGTSAAEATFHREWSAFTQRWTQGMDRVHHDGDRLGELLRRQPMPFPSAADIRIPESAAPAVRLGVLHTDFHAVPGAIPIDERLAVAGPQALDLPLTLELPQRGSLLLEHAGSATPEARTQATSLLNAAVLRLLTTQPGGKARFTLIDPVGLGQSFASLMHLADEAPMLVGERIWTESKHIEQRLVDLTEHMETVIQKYLRNQFADIAAYNAQAGEVAEPYRFLVIADFPTGFSEHAMARLASIVSSGPRCGVYTLIASNVRERLPAGPLTMKDLERASLTLTHRQGRWTMLDPELAPLPLVFDAPPSEPQLSALVREIGRQSKDAGRVRVPLDIILPPAPQRWQGDSASELRIPLGRGGATKLQYMTLGRGTAQHALIAGRTGSGKSTLLHVIITSLATWYSPEQVEMYLVDFKKGVEFKAYATHHLPHARVVAIESEREFGVSVLRRLDEELQRRGELFRSAGVQDLAGFRRTVPVTVMPRIVLIVDEFQELFSEDDKLAQEASLLLDRLVRQGRAFGMHVILGSQTLAGTYSLPRSTIGQMAVRVALQCSEADSYLILSDDNPAARLLSRPGEAIYNDASGMLEGNSPFQVAWLDDDRRERVLSELHGGTATGGTALQSRVSAYPMLVFEGSRPAELERCAPINRLLSSPPSTPPAVVLAYLGDAVAIKDATHARFGRSSAANLLVVGQRDESGIGMLAGAMATLGASLRSVPTRTPHIILLDGTPADQSHAGVLPSIAAALGSIAKSIDYRDVAAAIDALHRELRTREAGSTAADNPAAPIVLVIAGLQRFRMLRKREDDWGAPSLSSDDAAAAQPDKQLVELLEKGPPLGLHTIVWCDTLANLERTLPRSSVREFDTRVLMQVSTTDSSALIDSPAAGALGAFRAILFSESLGVLEKFRPFAVPPVDWIARVRASLT